MSGLSDNSEAWPGSLLRASSKMENFATIVNRF